MPNIHLNTLQAEINNSFGLWAFRVRSKLSSENKILERVDMSLKAHSCIVLFLDRMTLSTMQCLIYNQPQGF